MSRLLTQFKSKILPELRTELKLSNDFSVPRVSKITVNAGIGRVLQNQPKALDQILDVMKKITGQKPVVTKAAKAISAFKIREGQIVGVKVTLRGKRMYEFLDKLVNITLPRTRDFRGIPRSAFDGHGNYSVGIREYLVFPEMAQEQDATSFGLQVIISTTAGTDESAYLLLKKFGFQFNNVDNYAPRLRSPFGGLKATLSQPNRSGHSNSGRRP